MVFLVSEHQRSFDNPLLRRKKHDNSCDHTEDSDYNLFRAAKFIFTFNV